MISRVRNAGLIVTVLGVACTGAVVYRLITREGDRPQGLRSPSCRIQFMGSEERTKLANYLIEIGEVELPFPADQLDNPVLHPGRLARVEFVNTTDGPITVFSLQRWPIDPEVRKSNKDMALAIRNGSWLVLGNERRRSRILKNLEDEPSPPTIRNAFIVAEEFRDSSGTIIEENDLSAPPLGAHRTIPPSGELLARNLLTFTVQPGEVVELPVSVLGKQRPANRLKPGTHTVRAIVSYAEAPSGETKRITSEPVTVTVTEEHIKAAETYWAAAKN